MSPYNLLLNIVRSGVWEQEAPIPEVGMWAWHWLKLSGQTDKEADRNLRKAAQDEGLFFDGVEEEFLDGVDSAKRGRSDLSLPVFGLGITCEFLPKASGEKYARGSISKIDWCFKDRCWRYCIGKGVEWLPEEQLTRLSEQVVDGDAEEAV